MAIALLSLSLSLSALLAPAGGPAVKADTPPAPCDEVYAGGCELGSDEVHAAVLGPTSQLQMWEFRADGNGPLDGVYEGNPDSRMRVETLERKTIFADTTPDADGKVAFHADVEQGYYRIAVAAGDQGTGTPYSISATFPSDTGRPAATSTQCNGKVIRGFGNVYNTDPTVRARLGCPRAAERGLLLAEEAFEYGHMTWRSDSRDIVVATGHDHYDIYPDTYTEGEALSPLRAPDGLYTPIRGFGKLWRLQGDLITVVGYARGAERGFAGAIQDFDNGTMIWMGADQRIIRILYSGNTWVLVHDTFVDN